MDVATYKKMKGKHLREIVEKLLRENTGGCRTDTKKLTYLVMRHYTKIFIPFNDFKKIPSFESVARCKRDIMNREGKFNEDFLPEVGVTYEKPNSD